MKYTEAKYKHLRLSDNIDASDLQNIVGEMDELFQQLNDSRKKLLAARALIKEKMIAYESGRLEKFKKWLEENKKGWCGVCDSVVDSSELSLIYIEYFQWDPEYDGDVELSTLTTACGSCYKNFLNTTDHPRFSVYARRFYGADSRNEKYFYSRLTWVRPKNLPLDYRGGYTCEAGPLEWKEILSETRIILLPLKISLNLTKTTAMPPHIEFVEEDGVGEKNAHIAAYVGAAEEDYFIADDRVLIKIDED